MLAVAGETTFEPECSGCVEEDREDEPSYGRVVLTVSVGPTRTAITGPTPSDGRLPYHRPMQTQEAMLIAQVIPVVALAAIVEVREILSARRQAGTSAGATEPNVGSTGPRATTRPETSTPQDVILAILVFALVDLAAGETSALLVIFGLSSNVAAVVLQAKNELILALLLATNVIFLAPAGQALARLVAVWNASAAEAPGSVDSERRRQVKGRIRWGACIALLLALYVRVLVLA